MESGCGRMADASPDDAASPGQRVGAQRATGEEETLAGTSVAEMPTDLELPTDLKSCLTLNKTYQAWVEQAIEELAERLKQNRLLQRELPAQLAPRPLKPRVRRNWSHSLVFHHPYFRDINGMPAPKNEDTRAKLANKEPDPYLTPSPPWTSDENRRLVDAVKTNLLQQSLQCLMDRKEALAKRLLDTEDPEQRAQLTERKDQLDKQFVGSVPAVAEAWHPVVTLTRWGQLLAPARGAKHTPEVERPQLPGVRERLLRPLLADRDPELPLDLELPLCLRCPSGSCAASAPLCLKRLVALSRSFLAAMAACLFLILRLCTTYGTWYLFLHSLLAVGCFSPHNAQEQIASVICSGVCFSGVGHTSASCPSFPQA
ncbi:hypothetical protein HPB49_010682 [Dermacentor silvarum]|uniref:Uncharacterized protein n=1 Tax=Dermacentor silvarum TaxID=543639 RepID=A0ACB8DYV4_DERSI|nr:hypothetical protein HPB49_010682 [Dermacentor silvarum]